MNGRTYELISCWAADDADVSIEFSTEPVAPHCEMDTRKIVLPANIKDENVYAALALVMHEAGHLKMTMTDKMAKRITKGDKKKFSFLNALEDVRVDRNQMRLLPNVREFYKKLYSGVVKDKWSELDMPEKIMIRMIYNELGMNAMLPRDPQADQAYQVHRNSLSRLIDNLSWYIDYENEVINIKFYEEFDKLYEAIFGKDKDEKQKSKPQRNQNEEKECKDGEEGEESDEGGSGKSEQADESPSKGHPSKQSGKTTPDSSEKKRIAYTKLEQAYKKPIEEIFSQSKYGSSSQGHSIIGKAAFDEITKSRLKDMLNIKCNRIVEDGNKLNTDSLLSYHTGDLDSLFVEDNIVKKKKSKIMFLLDCSGSMAGYVQICDKDAGYKNAKQVVLAEAVQSIADIFDEIMESEGSNVEYVVNAFDHNYHALDKKLWKEQYFNKGGGTDLKNAFEKAHDEMSMDQELDGQKIIILFTDGEVDTRDVEYAQNLITTANSQVKCLIIGIGAKLNSDFVKKLVGDNNIVAAKYSSEIISEAALQLMSQ